MPLTMLHAPYSSVGNEVIKGRGYKGAVLEISGDSR